MHLSEFVIDNESQFSGLYTYLYYAMIQSQPVIDLLFTGVVAFVGAASDYVY